MRGNRRTGRVATRNIGRTRRWETILILTICAAFLCFITIDSYRFVKGLKYWHRNREVKQEYVREVEKLQQKQQWLEDEIDKLKNNTLTKERLAREIGYIKPGETVYKFEPTE